MSRQTATYVAVAVEVAVNKRQRRDRFGTCAGSRDGNCIFVADGRLAYA